MGGVQFRRFKKADALRVVRLIRKVSNEFNRKEGTKEGNQYFFSLYMPSKVTAWTKDYCILAEYKGKLLGLGRAKQNGWITHCYVRKSQMGKGFGKELMLKMERWLYLKEHRKVFLNSSLFAHKFYKKLGYKDISHVKTYHGLRMNPMNKRL